MYEFTLIGTLLNVGPLEETSSGIKVVNFIIECDRPFESNATYDEFQIMVFKELVKSKLSFIIFFKSEKYMNSEIIKSENYYE